jgi:DNA-binding transcriptional ArsR family regulator
VPSPARIRSTIATYADAPEELRELRVYHKALADVTRLKLVERLAAGPATVTELVAHVDLSQPLVSWHLHQLRLAGVIDRRRSGREMICSLRSDTLERFARGQLALADAARANGGSAEPVTTDADDDNDDDGLERPAHQEAAR